MEPPSTSTGSLSSLSSNSSLTSDALKTPCDATNPSPPDSFTESKFPPNELSERLELVPKRASTAPVPPLVQSRSAAGTCRPLPGLDRRTRRITNSSVGSLISTASTNSLLRATLLISSSSSRPSSTFSATGTQTPLGTGSGTSSLLTEASNFSIASITLSSSDPAGHGALGNRQGSISSFDPSGPNDNVRPAISLAAEPTTALSPSTSSSLAQFSPTPAATTSLLRYGIHASHSPSAANGCTRTVEARRQRSRDRSPARHRQIPDEGTYHRHNSHNLPHGGKATTPSASRPIPNLPQISRAIAPDSPVHTMLGTPRHYATTRSKATTLDVVPANSQRQFTSTCGFPGTPRPPFPIDDKPSAVARSTGPSLHPSKLSQHLETKPISSVDKGKGRATVPFPRASTLPISPSSSSPTHTFFDTLPKAQRSMLQPPPPVKPRADLPTLENIEASSRLMRARIICAACGDVGPDFPRCGRCGEAWCSRSCRVRANEANGGKHRCAANAAK